MTVFKHPNRTQPGAILIKPVPSVTTVSESDRGSVAGLTPPSHSCSAASLNNDTDATPNSSNVGCHVRDGVDHAQSMIVHSNLASAIFCAIAVHTAT